ncbi:MAG: prepilin-type N-terminal cleavage/methylation domain-containing protein [Clostridium butyricum]|nr:prepilin-type N-terminal cleavage/methylation domain-containing protein [Clostridium butyricum]
MKRKSKRKLGFTLLETIISIAIIGIISAGIYGSYSVLIRHTKDGEVRQKASLAGKKISEEIKASGDNIKKNVDNTIKLTDEITLNDQKKATIMMTRDGNITTDESVGYYKVNIEMEAKNTDEGNRIEISKEDYDNRLFVGNSLHSSEDSIKKKTILTSDKKIDISINNTGKTIKMEYDKEITINKDCVVLDFKYCNDKSKFTINVNNETPDPFKLFILNSKDTDKIKNITVDNKKGILHEYYRKDSEKAGRLYNVKIDVNKKNSNNSDNPLFQTDFVQNINIG